MQKTPKPISEAIIRAIRAHVTEIDGYNTIGENFHMCRAKQDGSITMLIVNDSFVHDEREWIGIVMNDKPYVIRRNKFAGRLPAKGVIYTNTCDLTPVTYNAGDIEKLIHVEEITRLNEESVIVRKRMQEEIDILKGKMAILEDENTVLKGQLEEHESNKRKREEEEREDVDADEMPRRECVRCKKPKDISSFRVTSKKKNKEGTIVTYVNLRTICAGCRTSAHRKVKKTRVSK